MLATWNGHIDVVKVLLESYATLHVANREGDTTLRIACIDGRKEIIDLLLIAGVNVNQISSVRESRSLIYICDVLIIDFD